MGHSEYWDRIASLADQARRDTELFTPPESPPDEECAMKYLRRGVGPAVWVYIEARTGGELAPFSSVEMALLQRALNDWLELYALCYGVDLDADFTVREAATILMDTHNVRDTAQLLTRVPPRRSRRETA